MTYRARGIVLIRGIGRHPVAGFAAHAGVLPADTDGSASQTRRRARQAPPAGAQPPRIPGPVAPRRPERRQAAPEHAAAAQGPGCSGQQPAARGGRPRPAARLVRAAADVRGRTPLPRPRRDLQRGEGDHRGHHHGHQYRRAHRSQPRGVPVVTVAARGRAAGRVRAPDVVVLVQPGVPGTVWSQPRRRSGRAGALPGVGPVAGVSALPGAGDGPVAGVSAAAGGRPGGHGLGSSRVLPRAHDRGPGLGARPGSRPPGAAGGQWLIVGHLPSGGSQLRRTGAVAASTKEGGDHVPAIVGVHDRGGDLSWRPRAPATTRITGRLPGRFGNDPTVSTR